MKVKFELGFFLVLFIVFLTLKLCEVIAWPWIWICAPLWIPAAAVVAFFVLAFIAMLCVAIVHSKVEK